MHLQRQCLLWKQTLGSALVQTEQEVLFPLGAVVEFELMMCVESPLPPDSVLRYQMRRIPRKHSLTRLPAQCQHGLLPKDLIGATVVSTSQSFLHIRTGPAHPAQTLTVLQALPNPGFVSYLRPCPWLPVLHPPGLFPALDLPGSLPLRTCSLAGPSAVSGWGPGALSHLGLC